MVLSELFVLTDDARWVSIGQTEVTDDEASKVLSVAAEVYQKRASGYIKFDEVLLNPAKFAAIKVVPVRGRS